MKKLTSLIHAIELLIRVLELLRDSIDADFLTTLCLLFQNL